MSAIYLMAGGPEHLIPEHFFQSDDVLFIGVDEGVIYLVNRGIQPDAAFGDFDSISDEQLQKLEEKQMNVFTFDREKDMTDLELAIRWALDQKPEKIGIYGATGGRLDHEQINIQMLKQGLDHEVHMEIVDRNNIVFMRRPGKYLIDKDENFPYISFVPFSPIVKGITLDGFRYPLDKATVEWGSTLCISNELVTKKGTYSFDDGIIMVVRSKD